MAFGDRALCRANWQKGLVMIQQTSTASASASLFAFCFVFTSLDHASGLSHQMRWENHASEAVPHSLGDLHGARIFACSGKSASSKRAIAVCTLLEQGARPQVQIPVLRNPDESPTSVVPFRCLPPDAPP